MKPSSNSLLFCAGMVAALNSVAAPSPPQLTVLVDGLTVTANWTASPGATGYTLFYAPKPFTGPESIQSAEMNGKQSFSAELWIGAEFYIAIKSYDNSGLSEFSNVLDFSILPVADIDNDWLVNNVDERSAFIFENRTEMTGVLVNVESVISSEESVTVKSFGIPNYQVLIDQILMDKLDKQPVGDFINGPNVMIGDSIEFGQNIGYVQTPMAQNCTSTGGEGYWPPGPDCPQGIAKSKKFTTTPSPAEGSCTTSNGAIGYMVNGTSVYNWSDAQVDNSIWHRLAPVFEEYDVDVCGGHAARGDYHHHFYTQCLADTVGDKGDGHSPLYGYADDGYPIYGPWHAAGVLAFSSWVVRDYNDEQVGCSDGQRSCVMADEYDPGKGTVNASTAGYDIGYEKDIVPQFRNGTIIVNAGAYYEDMYWDAGLAAQGDHFLDQHNGHDHDGLGYHYHITVTGASDGRLIPAFPYIIGPTFYGSTTDCK